MLFRRVGMAWSCHFLLTDSKPSDVLAKVLDADECKDVQEKL
jgi:hypothetical protein